VLPLRLLSVAFGVVLVVVVFAAVQAIFPTRPEIALTATALTAFIPQHVAMTAGVNNDTPAELIVASTLWALGAYLQGKRGQPWHVILLLAAGMLLAMALLTKDPIYIVPLAILTAAIRWRSEERTWQWAAVQLAWMLIPALLLSTPWSVRNGLTYRWLDLTGQTRRQQRSAGRSQPTRQANARTAAAISAASAHSREVSCEP
jgi:4-amino-4-deoxy-L-arabinose transferase-like glycosyltransferase